MLLKKKKISKYIIDDIEIFLIMTEEIMMKEILIKILLIKKLLMKKPLIKRILMKKNSDEENYFVLYI